MADTSSTQAALLSCGLLQRHLLPRLCLSDLLCIECVSTAFQHLICSAPDAVWTAVIARTVPPSHHLAKLPETGRQQAARQYATLQRAIQTEDITTTCAIVLLRA